MYDINNDITLIWNYINGDLVDNKVRLEDDYKFMVDVLNVSRDKNMYYNCSDDLKYSFDLSYFIIDKFRDDDEFEQDDIENENVNGECEIIEFNKALAKRKNKNK